MEDMEIRQAALLQLSRWNKELISKIAKNDSDLEMRQLAVVNLHDYILLEAIADNDKDEEIRRTAKERLYWLKNLPAVIQY